MVLDRRFIAALVLAALVALSWWLSKQQQPGGEGYQPAEHTPDYYLEGMDATQMGPDGRPARRLAAERLVHYPDDDSTELTKPHFTFYVADRPPWRAHSETGWLSGDGEVLLMQGEVKIDRSAVPGVRPVHITTRDLRVQPGDYYAETDAQVFAHSGRDRLNGRGMQVWFMEPVRIKLLAKARGHYEVNQ